ncbi:MAG: phage portal protein family [Bacilli bacterium]|nr:phage portal protein family [Bacilli bacterium]
MGVLSRLVVKNQGLNIDQFFDQKLSRYFGGISHSGVMVTEESAMRFVTVYSCVRVLSETFASLPLSIFKKMPNGGSQPATDHPVHGLIHAAPNDEMTSYTWKESQMVNLTLSGNNFSIITPNRRGQITDIFPLTWFQVDVRRDLLTDKIQYWVTDRGKSEYFPPEKIFHVPGLGWDGLRGYSPIRMNAQAVGLGIAQSEFSERFYGQGMNMGGVLEHPQTLGDTAFDRLQKDLESRGSGLANSWKPLILEGGMKYARMPMPLTEAQFIESKKLTKDDICGIYRVQPHLISNLAGATNNNIEQQSLEFIMYTEFPYITKWEQTINWKLFTKEERQQGYYAKFNLDAFLRGDSAARGAYLNLKRQNGIINANTWRQLDDENPIDGPAGEAYIVNGNMMSTENAAKNMPRAATLAAPEGGDTKK